MDYSNIPLGFKITTQIPLDSKTSITNESLLKDLGFNNNLAFTYFDGMVITCQLEKTDWQWREALVGEQGLLTNNFTYPDGIVSNGITYSLKNYNFFEPKVLSKKVEKVLNKSLVLDSEITKLSHLDDTTDLQKPVSTAQQAAINAQLIDSVIINNVTTSSTVPPTGNIHALGIGTGTYPNWGGMVVPANNIGTLQRVDGVYSVSLTAIDLTSKVNVSDVVNTLTSTETAKPLSAAQGKVLNEKIAQGIISWTAKAYLSGDQVNYLGKDWVSNAATVAGDVPGTSSKWIDRLNSKLNISDLSNNLNSTSSTQGLNLAGAKALNDLKSDKTDVAKKADLIAGKNKFNKVAYPTGHYLTGFGIGTDGVIYTTASQGIAISAVKENTSYVISGSTSSRCLRFEKADGSLVAVGSFLDYTNGVPFTTPIGTERIRYEIEVTSSPSFNTVMLEEGIVATTYEAYQLIITPEQINPYNYATLATKKIIGKNKFNKVAYPTGHYRANYGIGEDGTLYASASHGIAMGVPVTANKNYVISGAGFDRVVRFEKADGSLVYVGSFLDYSNGFFFTTPAGTEKISFQFQYMASPTFNALQLEEGIVATTYEAYTENTYAEKWNGFTILPDAVLDQDYDVIFPKNIFVPQNDINGSFSTNQNVSVWVQKIIKEKKNLLLNRVDNLSLNKYANTANVDSNSKTLILNGVGFREKAAVVPIVSVKNSLLAAQFPKVLYLGDSITINRLKNGAIAGAGSMWSLPKEIAVKNKIDNAGVGYDYLCIGTQQQINTTISYKSQTPTLLGYAEGRGGYGACTYLRHPCRMWVFNNQGAWDLLGLTTLMGRNYVSGNTDNKLIATTIYGVNTPLVTANSYDLLVKESQITNLGAWSNSGAQNTAVQDWINGVASGAITQNEFFDISKSGTNRFSIAKYLDRYKTLSNDGTTRLVVGGTAGTKVTSATAYDVCEPTHIVVCLGENDRLAYTDNVQSCNDIIEITNEIHLYKSTIEIGVCLTAIPGDMFPERHPDFVGYFYQSHHDLKFELYKELSSRFGLLATQKINKKYLIPTWHTGTPLSNSLTKEVISENEPNKIIQVGNDDYNHPGYYHNRSAGVQIYGWVAYTKS